MDKNPSRRICDVAAIRNHTTMRHIFNVIRAQYPKHGPWWLLWTSAKIDPRNHKTLVSWKLLDSHLSYCTFTRTRFPIDRVSRQQNRIEKGTVSKCLHGDCLTVSQVFSKVFCTSKCCSPREVHHVYSLRASQFRAKIRNRLQIDAFAISAVYATNETVSFWKRSTSDSVFKTTQFQFGVV